MSPMAPDPSVTLMIDGTWNARDAATLTKLRPGVLLRTAGLGGLTASGRERLAELGVTDVIDLRSDAEVRRDGADATGEVIRVHRLGITAGANLTAQGARTEAEAMEMFFAQAATPGWTEEFMASVYRHLVSDPEAIAALGAGLNLLADPERVVLVHCSAGKDRTGIFVALAATIAGADQADIDADFLYSNHAISDQASVAPRGIDPERLAPLLGVHLDSLNAARAMLLEQHGSWEQFLAAAGVSHQARESIKDRLAS